MNIYYDKEVKRFKDKRDKDWQIKAITHKIPPAFNSRIDFWRWCLERKSK